MDFTLLTKPVPGLKDTRGSRGRMFVDFPAGQGRLNRAFRFLTADTRFNPPDIFLNAIMLIPVSSKNFLCYEENFFGHPDCWHFGNALPTGSGSAPGYEDGF